MFPEKRMFSAPAVLTAEQKAQLRELQSRYKASQKAHMDALRQSEEAKRAAREQFEICQGDYNSLCTTANAYGLPLHEALRQIEEA